MFRKLFVTLTLATVLGTTAHAAMAADGDQDFTLHNNTGFKITKLYVEPESNTKDWGDEMLNGAAIASGEEQELKFTGYGKECVFAISITDPAGNDYEVRNIDLCKFTDITFYKQGGKVMWKAN